MTTSASRLTPFGKGDADDVFNLYYDPAHYDRRYRDYLSDVPCWEDVARRFGPAVLELACGSGRIAIPMAQGGAVVTGIDVSRAMLDVATRKASDAGVSLRLLEADMRSFVTGDRYDCVAIPCSSLCHLLDKADFSACMARIRDELTPGGVLCIDVISAWPSTLPDDVSEAVPRFNYDTEEGRVEVVGQRSFDWSTQILTDLLEYRFEHGGTRQVRRRSRIFFPAELEALLWMNGFEVVERHGDHRGGPFDGRSRTQFLVCVRRTDERGSQAR